MPSARHRRRSRVTLKSRLGPQQGFTLLELIVGVTIFSMITVVLYSGFRIGVRSWEAGEARAEGTEEIRIVEGFLRDYLRKAVPLRTKRGGRTALQFEGREDSLHFIAEMPPHLGFGGLYELSLTVTEQDGERGLSMTRRLLHPDVEERLDVGEDNDRGVVDTRMLVEGVDTAEFAYYGSSKAGDTPEWRNSWTEARNLPVLVRLRVSTQPAAVWPELIVRLRVDGAPVQRPDVNSSVERPRGLTDVITNMAKR